MYEYEPAIAIDDFKDTDEVESLDRVFSIAAARSVQERPQTNQSDLWFCSVEKLWLETPGKVGPENTSFSDKAAVPTGDPSRWHFAPKVERAKICWQLTGRPSQDNKALVNAAELKIELFIRNSPAAFWKKTMKWKAGECLLRGSTDFDGQLAEDLHKSAAGKSGPTGDVTVELIGKEAFPDGVLTVDQSPYKLKLTIIDAADARQIVSRWVYFDILVDTLELKWGEYSVIPPSRSDIADPHNKKKVLGDRSDPNNIKKGYEELILEDLKKEKPDPVDGFEHKVRLMSNVFPFQKKRIKDNVESYMENVDYRQYEALWGKGPRIPLVVRAFIKKSTAEKTRPAPSADGRTDQVPEALGKSKIIWDWNESVADRWKQSIAGTTAKKTEGFLAKAYSKNDAVKPVAKSNCPAEFGGKHGDPSDNGLVFPVQPQTAEFPNKVEKSAGRKWSSLSGFGTGEKRGESTVVFQPSRFAGDRYKVTGFLHFDRYVDTEDDIQAPPAVQTKPCEFKVFRQINLHSLRRGGVSVAALDNAVKTHYLKELDMFVEVKPVAVDNGAYTNALRVALGRLCRKEHFVDEVKGLDLIPLLCRFAVDTAPPDGSPGVVFRDWADIKGDVENLFQNGSLRVVRSSSPDLVDETVTGQTSGNSGTLLRVGGKTLAVFQPNAQLTKSEDIVGQLSSVTDVVEFDSSARSCWGRRIDVVAKTEKDDKIYKESIKVVFPGNREVTVTYTEKSRFAKTLTAELPESAKTPLRSAFSLALAAHNETQPFNITVNARTDSENSRIRHKNLTDFLEGLFNDFSMVDRKPYCDQLLGRLKSAFLGAEAVKYQKMMALLLVGEIVWEYASQRHPDEEGIFLLHLPGQWKGYSLGADDVQEPVKMPKVKGAVYPELTGDTNSRPLRVRDRAIAYMATVPDDQSDGKETKTPESIIKHELAHGLFLPHAPAKTKQTPSPKGICHVKDGEYDDCLMNYDLESENFCGLCIQRLRGWNWRSTIRKSVTAVRILDGNDTTYLNAAGVQYVNLPKEAKWVDPVNTGNLDRLSRKVRVKVEFDPNAPGDKCYVQVFGHRDNSVYSDEEKARKPSFNIRQEPAEMEIGEFDRLVGDEITGQRGPNNSCVLDVELPPAGGDRFKIAAWGEDFTRAESVEITTWRIVYYMTMISQEAVALAVPNNTFETRLTTEYRRHFIKPVCLGNEQIVGHPYWDTVLRASFVQTMKTLTDKEFTPGKRYSDYRPYLLRFVRTDQLVEIREGKLFHYKPAADFEIASADRFGESEVVQVGPAAASDTVDIPTIIHNSVSKINRFHRSLFVGMGNAIGLPPLASGNTWLVSAKFKPNDGSPEIDIPFANCTAVDDVNLANPLTDYDSKTGAAMPVTNNAGRFRTVRVSGLRGLLPNDKSGHIAIDVRYIVKYVAGQAGVDTGLLLNCTRYEYAPKSFNEQICISIHEMGHELGMNAFPGNSGLDNHPFWYQKNGDHCSFGLSPALAATKFENQATNAQCVMYAEVLNPPRDSFCVECEKKLRKLDLSGGFK